MVLYVLEPMALKSSPCACSTNIQSLQHTTKLERLDVWRIDLSGAAEGRATSTFPSLVTSRAAALSANSTSTRARDGGSPPSPHTDRESRAGTSSVDDQICTG
jgi:hypothetical protein